MSEDGVPEKILVQLEHVLLTEYYKRKRDRKLILAMLPSAHDLPDDYKEVIEEANVVVRKHLGKEFRRFTGQICIWYWAHDTGKKGSLKKVNNKINKLCALSSEINSIINKSSLDGTLSEILKAGYRFDLIDRKIDPNISPYDKFSVKVYSNALFDIFNKCKQLLPEHPEEKGKNYVFPLSLSCKERLILNLARIYGIGGDPSRGSLEYAAANIVPSWDKISNGKLSEGAFGGPFYDFVGDFFKTLKITDENKNICKNKALGKMIYGAFSKVKKVMDS